MVEQLRAGRFGDAADLLEQAAADVLASIAFPRGCWRQIWSNNPRSAITASLAIGQPDPTKQATPALTSTAA